MRKIYRCPDCGGAAEWERERGNVTMTHVFAYCTVCREWKWIPRE
ncbi:hypothetical protein PDK93_28190 [Bacillus cereus]|nr:hypothetical protein [Bacillus cereus]